MEASTACPAQCLAPAGQPACVHSFGQHPAGASWQPPTCVPHTALHNNSSQQHFCTCRCQGADQPATLPPTTSCGWQQHRPGKNTGAAPYDPSLVHPADAQGASASVQLLRTVQATLDDLRFVSDSDCSLPPSPFPAQPAQQPFHRPDAGAAASMVHVPAAQPVPHTGFSRPMHQDAGVHRWLNSEERQQSDGQSPAPSPRGWHHDTPQPWKQESVQLPGKMPDQQHRVQHHQLDRRTVTPW